MPLVRPGVMARVAPGATHEKLKVYQDSSSRSWKSLLAPTGAVISKPTRVVAEQPALPQRSHASPLPLTPISPAGFGAINIAHGCVPEADLARRSPN